MDDLLVCDRCHKSAGILFGVPWWPGDVCFDCQKEHQAVEAAKRVDERTGLIVGSRS